MQLLVDIVNGIEVDQGLKAQTLTGTAAGSVVDLSNCQESCNAVVNVGTIAAGGTSVAVKVQECATTTGTFTDIAGMDTGAITTAGVTAIRGARAQRYVKAFAYSAIGQTVSIPASVEFVNQKKISPATGGYDRYPSS